MRKGGGVSISKIEKRDRASLARLIPLIRLEVEFLISAVRWHLPLGLVTKGTRGRVQILLTVKSLTLALGIQLETILSQGPGNQTTRAGLPSSVNL